MLSWETHWANLRRFLKVDLLKEKDQGNIVFAVFFVQVNHSILRMYDSAERWEHLSQGQGVSQGMQRGSHREVAVYDAATLKTR